MAYISNINSTELVPIEKGKNASKIFLGNGVLYGEPRCWPSVLHFKVNFGRRSRSKVSERQDSNAVMAFLLIVWKVELPHDLRGVVSPFI